MGATDMLRGRQTAVRTLTNKSGGSVAAGDVVVIGDGTNDDAFTTTTTASFNARMVGVAMEAIASNAAGLVALHGYVPKIVTSASVNRDDFLFTHTVAKQATGSATRAAGAFGQVLATGTSPAAILWGTPDATNAPVGGSITASGYTQNTAKILGRTTASSGAIEEISIGSGLSLSGGSLTAPAGLMIVRGHVNSTGGIVAGSGFTVSHPSTGRYDLTFSPAFPTAPMIVAMLDNGYFNHNGINALGVAPTTTTATVKAEDTGIAPGDAGFFFIAIEG